MSIKQIDQAYIANTYARFPVELISGSGSVLTDSEGKTYIDLAAGIAANTFGAADSAWVEAVTSQLNKLAHTSNLYYTEPCALLAQTLCERTGAKKVFFGNSGAEANECAIKAARKYAFDKYGDESHSTIITLKNSFHGRTITTLAATGQEHYHEIFSPFTPGFVYAEPNDIASVTALSEQHDCCAVMIELVQGEGGVCPLNPEYVNALTALAKAHDMLLIIDEVQTGNGRSGQLYAYMNYGITPDIITTAKGLGGGLPIGACLLFDKLADTFTPGTHGSTFGGNPVCCAGALSVISRLDDDFLAAVREKSDYIFTELSGAAGVEAVSGLGLMIGVKTKKPASEIVSGCIERGVLVITAKDRVRLLPPLNIPMELLKTAIGILKEVIEK